MPIPYYGEQRLFDNGNTWIQRRVATFIVLEGEPMWHSLQGNKELASAAFNARVIPSVAYTDPRSRLGRLDRRPGQGTRHQYQKGSVPVERIRPRDCQRPR